MFEGNSPVDSDEARRGGALVDGGLEVGMGEEVGVVVNIVVGQMEDLRYGCF